MVISILQAKSKKKTTFFCKWYHLTTFSRIRCSTFVYSLFSEWISWYRITFKKLFFLKYNKTNLGKALLIRHIRKHTRINAKMCVEVFSLLKRFPYCLFFVFNIKDLEYSFRVIIVSLVFSFIEAFLTDAVVSNL